MLNTIFLRYTKLLVICIVLLKGPIILNYPEVTFNLTYRIVKKSNPWLTINFFRLVNHRSLKYGLHPALVCSLITSESYHWIYRPTLYHMKRAISASGACSYMQVMPIHGGNLFNIHVNLHKGMLYLRACIYSSGGNLREALRKYNQGISGNRTQYGGWNTYVKPILRRYFYSLHLLKKLDVQREIDKTYSYESREMKKQGQMLAETHK